MFMFHLSLMAALAVFAGGMLLLYKSRREPEAGVLRVTGIVLIVGSIASALCITYFGAKYYFQGDFNSPCPQRMGMPGGMHGGMGTMMRGGMMGGMGMMGPGPAASGQTPPPNQGTPPAAGGPQHHPDTGAAPTGNP